MIFGLDYAWPPHPSVAKMREANVAFVCRYVSHDSDKDLSLSEARAYADAGIWSVLVFETSAGRALAGYSAGQADAQEALRRARELLMPADRPIYFAVDQDVNGADVADYFRGLINVLTKERVGVYGSYRVVVYLASHDLASYYWQTYAWSGGKWRAGNDIEQYRNGVSFGGADVDYNRAYGRDWGQFKPGKSPLTKVEDNMPIRYAGQLRDGNGAVTAISIHPGDVEAIGFAADHTLEGLNDVVLRVSFHDAVQKRWTAPSMLTLTKEFPKKWVNLPSTIDIVSVQRVSQLGNFASVGYDAS